MRILLLIINITEVTLLITLSITELDNEEVHYATWDMKSNNRLLTDNEFLSNFNCAFSCKQSFNLVNLLLKWTLKLMREMQTELLRTNSYLQLLAV